MNYQGRQMIVGNGGGFTGAVNTHFLTDDGKLYQQDKADSSYIKVGSISRQLTKQFFKTYDLLALDKLELDEPGNRYYFIIMRDKQGRENKLQWGKKELENTAIKIFYDNVMATIKAQNQTIK